MEPHVFFTEVARPEQLDPEPRYPYVTVQDEVYRLEISERMIEAERIRYRWDELSADEVEETIRDVHEIIDVDAMDLSADAEAILEAARVPPPYDGTAFYSEAEWEVLNALDLEEKDVGTDTRWVTFRERYYDARARWWHSD